jgi:predicted house-cleaning noncanonical NTP pyrophosphatase (MazG superfamily)
MEKPEGIDKILESGSLEKYGLKFAGIGAEKVCFETVGSTKKLIKVDTYVLRRKILEFLNDNGRKTVSDTTDEEAKIDEDMKMDEGLAEVFGNDHVVKKSVFRFPVPVTRDIALAVLDEDQKSLAGSLSEAGVFEVEMLIETQPIAEELRDREKHKTISLNTGLLIYDDFIGSKDVPEALKKVEALVNDAVGYCEQNWSKNSESLEVIKEVVSKIIQYTKKTGLMLDIFGPDNITIFINKEGKWDFHLLDAVLPGEQDYWAKNIGDDIDLRLLRHCYTFYYSINLFAKKVGLIKNLEPDDMLYFKGAGIPDGKFPAKNNV